MEKKEILSTKHLVFTVLLALVVLSSTSVFGATIRVPADYPTIQAGIDAAVGGDIVIVADGTYMGLGNKDLDFNGKAITVRSENGPENCVINCQGIGRGFYFHSSETTSSVLSGFTITNGNIDYGGGIRCSSSPIITNCNIIGNTAEMSGGGIFLVLGSATITNCAVIDNTGYWGGGIFISNARPQITNCTITGNTATQGGGIRIQTAGPTITNCILWDDKPSEFSISLEPGGDIHHVRYCDVESYEVTGNTIIHSNPLFVNVSDPTPAKWDLHLQPSSPCIDTGSNVAPGLPATDFEGDPRKIDGDGDGIATVDMGTDEYSECPQPPVAHFIGNPTKGIVPLTVQFTDQSTGEINSRIWDFGDNTTSSDINPSKTYENIGSYTVSLTVQGPECSDTEIKVNYIKVLSDLPIKALPCIPLLLLQEDASASWTTIMSEDFEGVFPSDSWQTSGDPTWGVDDYKPHTGSKSAWCARGGPSGIDPETNDYPSDMHAWMVYGPFDLSDAYDAVLIFKLWLKSEIDFDHFKWLASIDGEYFYGKESSGNTDGWVEKEFDLKSVYTLGNLCGESEVWIAFVFQSDDTINDEGAFVDNILLKKRVTQ